MSQLSHVRRILTTPVGGSSLVAFRVLFGMLLTWEASRYLARGWALSLYGPGVHFTYWPFDFIRPLPGRGMELVFGIMALAGVGVTLGFLYRLSGVLLVLTTSYVFLIDQVNYLNHWYLMVLLSVLMVVVPAHRRWSVDAWRLGEDRPLERWSLWLLRFQVAVPYVFGGIAKLNGDWLAGRPLGEWLADRADTPLVGWAFEPAGAGVVAAWAAMLLDLAAPVVILRSRRWRLPVFAAVVAFHLLNARLFSIGVFPALMVAGTTLLLPEDWPERMVSVPRRRAMVLVGLGTAAGAYWFAEGGIPQAAVFGLAAALLVSEAGRSGFPPLRRPVVSVPLGTMATVALALWVGLQVLVPLRHLVIEGDPSWTEEGHRFSWHMKLRDKDVERVVFEVFSAEAGITWWVSPEEFLTERQTRKMASHPDMLVQFARFLEAELAGTLPGDLQVMAHTAVSLNGREPRPLVDRDTDLTSVDRPWIGHADWILPRDGVSSGPENR